VDGQAVAVWDIPDRAAGHHRGTAPLGGHGNSVISGHISGTDEGVFRGLSDVTPGMEVFATDMDGVEHRYVVEQAVKVLEVGATLEQRQANARYMAPTDDSRITLITCWPNWAYTHRIIVVALLR
jgi:LPXTG-site transpeptidase (sortase) family protein